MRLSELEPGMRVLAWPALFGSYAEMAAANTPALTGSAAWRYGTGMTERQQYGIWSGLAGDFIQTGFWDTDGHDAARRFLTAARRGSAPETLDPAEAAQSCVARVCPRHDEYRAEACDACADERELARA